MLFDAAVAVDSAAAVVDDVDPLAASPFPPDVFGADVDDVAPAVAAEPKRRRESNENDAIQCNYEINFEVHTAWTLWRCIRT